MPFSNVKPLSDSLTLVGRTVVERFNDSLGSESWRILVFGAESILVSFDSLTILTGR